MELLTITGRDDSITEEREPLIQDLFPYYDDET
jgi:murein tripeptide amidase MpaA